MEDKQVICDLLAATLKATRNHNDLIKIKYERVNPDFEIVHVRWAGGEKKINVSLDSGEAMIRDIMNHLNS